VIPRREIPFSPRLTEFVRLTVYGLDQSILLEGMLKSIL
jgi:hypothetical protein